MEDDTKKQHHIIKLNVGGKIFVTSAFTLEKHNNSFFCDVINRQSQTDYFFIDRDPKYFERILDYFRDGILDISGLNKRGKAKLERDLIYYRIDLSKSKNEISKPTKEQDIPLDIIMPLKINKSCSVNYVRPFAYLSNTSFQTLEPKGAMSFDYADVGSNDYFCYDERINGIRIQSIGVYCIEFFAATDSPNELVFHKSGIEIPDSIIPTNNGSQGKIILNLRVGDYISIHNFRAGKVIIDTIKYESSHKAVNGSLFIFLLNN